MAIAELFQKKSTVFSFEVFPPKRTSSIDTIYSTLDQLKNLRPDFISVTYGAGGNVADQSTCEIASIIQNTYHCLLYTSSRPVFLVESGLYGQSAFPPPPSMV